MRFIYKNIFRKLFFLIDPEVIHDRMISFGSFLGKFSICRWIIRKLFFYSDKSLEQDILGIKFSNPVGLAAGFDKDGYLTGLLPDVGFGFTEVGSVTGEKCEGNKKPRLWRLKKEESLLVNYGLKSEGCESVFRRVRRGRIPVAISVAKTNSKDTVELEDGINDYLKVYDIFNESMIDFFIINISCPNAFGGRPFSDPKSLEALLSRLKKTRPIFVKLSPDLSNEQIDDIIEVCKRYDVDGFVCTNLSKKEKGGVSGKLLFERSCEVVKYVYDKTGMVVIGCGGISSAEDAYKMIKNGASLVQVITGMIYEGPQLVKEINKGLVKLMEKDGFKSISEAVGESL